MLKLLSLMVKLPQAPHGEEPGRPDVLAILFSGGPPFDEQIPIVLFAVVVELPDVALARLVDQLFSDLL